MAQPHAAPAAAGAKPELRRAFGRFPTGIAVVTTVDDEGAPFGITINSFVSVSMEPPMVSWNVIRGSRAHATISRARRFVVNVLAEEQRPIAQQMARPADDRFAGVDYRLSDDGLPVIADAVATFECSVHALVSAGDHDIVLGVVDGFAHRDGPPLVYWQGAYATAQAGDNNNH